MTYSNLKELFDAIVDGRQEVQPRDQQQQQQQATQRAEPTRQGGLSFNGPRSCDRRGGYGPKLKGTPMTQMTQMAPAETGNPIPERPKPIVNPNTGKPKPKK